MNLNWVDVPDSTTCKLGLPGGVGTLSGEPPSKVKDSVALSPSVMVSRSREAVKVAAFVATVAQKQQEKQTQSAKARPVQVRREVNPVATIVLRTDRINKHPFLPVISPACKFQLHPGQRPRPRCGRG